MERKGNPDNSTLANLTVYHNGTLHLVYQLLHNGHAKPGTVVMRPCALMFLGKRFKNVLLKFLTDANAGIFNHKKVICPATLTYVLLYLDKYRAMGTVIFEGVFDDIHQNLF